MTNAKSLIAQGALAALLAVAATGIAASDAFARDRHHHNDRIVERCDRWGDHCRLYRCDWDGDRCYRISAHDHYGPPSRVYYERDYYAPPPPPRNGAFLGVRVR